MRRTPSRNNGSRIAICGAASALLAAAAAWPLAGLAQVPRAPNPDGSSPVAQIEKTLVDAIARAEPSVVAITRSSPQPQPLIERGLGDVFRDIRGVAADDAAAVVGAGVLIDRAGLVLTQYLAIRDGDQHFVTTIDRTTYPATIRAADPRSGLAVLAIDTKAGPLKRASNAANVNPGSFTAIRFGDAETLRKGQFVVAIGNSFAIRSDGQPTASWGIVTNFARKAPAGTNLNDASGPANDYRTSLHHLGTLIQTDARLGWSTGGGALVNLRGELVGLTTTAATIAGHEQPAGYAIPINAAFERIINTLKEGREVEYGMLGVSFGEANFETPTGRGSRLTLLQVYPGSPAARAGLESGDVVTRVGDKPVGDVDAVQLAVSMRPPATTTTIDYLRSGRAGSASLTLAKLAVAGQVIASVRPESWQGLRVDYSTALDATQLPQAIAAGAYDAEGCVLVTEVAEGSAAWKAGVRKGMFISHVGGKRVTTPAEFQAAALALGEKFDIRLTQPVSPTPEGAKPDASKAE